MEEKPVVSEPLRECKFVVHVPKYEDRPDMHYIKEKIARKSCYFLMSSEQSKDNFAVASETSPAKCLSFTNSY